MPWKDTRVSDERMKLVCRYLEGEKVSDLSREFGISRKTAHKFINRFERFGPEGLGDQSRKPLRLARSTTSEIERLVVNFRLARETWGPKKIKARLSELHPGICFPAASTIGEILDRHGLINERKRRRGVYAYEDPLGKSEAANDIWCVDFKGQFRLKNSSLCYPLTVTDHFSRYVISIECLSNVRQQPVVQIFEEIFEEYGIPASIRSDNGVPFATRGLLGLSTLSAMWLKLGIKHERIEPGHPEQNGRHERMHLTLKQETTRPAAAHLLGQQEKCERFKQVFNFERPHEALKMQTPSALYSKAKKCFDRKLLEPDYPLHDDVKVVKPNGEVIIGPRKRTYVSQALAGEKLGLRKVAPNTFLLTFVNLDLGYINWKKPGQLLSENPEQPDV